MLAGLGAVGFGIGTARVRCKLDRFGNKGRRADPFSRGTKRPLVKRPLPFVLPALKIHIDSRWPAEHLPDVSHA
jgi:hypothetical protein